MEIIQKGFSLKYEVLLISSIKPGDAGSFNGTPYNASVKFRSTNIIQKENTAVGVQEIETIVEFKVPCATAKEAVAVSELLRKFRTSKTPIYINSDIPRKQSDADIYNVISFDLGDEFLKLNSSLQSEKAKV